jgi:shikimate 5-dehydrogenase
VIRYFFFPRFQAVDNGMNRNYYTKAEKPTMYFIGVTTEKSSIMKAFPKWADFLKLGDVEIKGINFEPHSGPELYREAVAFIEKDPLSLGALVTTHKIDLFHACRQMFDFIDEDAGLLGEASSISKRGGLLRAHAKDAQTSVLALNHIIPAGYWGDTGAHLMLIGAGGSNVALSSSLLKLPPETDLPQRIIITNRSKPRLDKIQEIHKTLPGGIPVDYCVSPQTVDNDILMTMLPPGSVVVNGTGMGKDIPGSPVSDHGFFPENGVAWDFNYRGDLIFLEQAKRQIESRHIRVEDGWIYFIHGWTRVIAEVFDVDIPTEGPVLDQLGRIALETATT